MVAKAESSHPRKTRRARMRGRFSPGTVTLTIGTTLLVLTFPAPGRADDFDTLLQLEKQFNARYEAARYREAEPIAQRMLTLAERSFTNQPEVIATSLHKLAIVYAAQGRYAEAEPLYKRSLALREKALGPEHPDVAASLNNLADAYHQQGKDVDAEPLLDRA